MGRESQQNWIDGIWREAAGGHAFEPGAPGSPEDLGRWPRSSSVDVLEAIVAGQGAAPSWSAARGPARAQILRSALEALASPPPRGRGAGREPRVTVARGLGLRRSELEPHRRAAREAGEELLERPGARASEGLALVRPRAGELFAGAVRRLFPALLAGQPALLVSDPNLPQVATELARALERAGLPPGVLALLHDDGETVLRAALAHPGVGRARLSGHEPELERLRQAAGQREPRSWGAGPSAPFGAGVLELAGAEVELHVLRNESAVVCSDEPDLDALAARVARAACGPAEALGGQADRQVARVFCHEARFSALTAALLAEVERIARAHPPVALLDRDLPGYVARLARLGLDEGATLISGASLGPADSRRQAGDANLLPAVFTNAEPRMRLVRARRPAPVLSLLRAASDREAEELARQADAPAAPATADAWG